MTPKSLLLRYRNPDALMLVYMKRFPTEGNKGKKKNENEKVERKGRYSEIIMGQLVPPLSAATIGNHNPHTSGESRI